MRRIAVILTLVALATTTAHAQDLNSTGLKWTGAIGLRTNWIGSSEVSNATVLDGKLRSTSTQDVYPVFMLVATYQKPAASKWYESRGPFVAVQMGEGSDNLINGIGGGLMAGWGDKYHVGGGLFFTQATVFREGYYDGMNYGGDVSDVLAEETITSFIIIFTAGF